MSAVEFVYRLRLTLAGPLLTAGLEARALGVDVAQLRDYRGRIVLPGTLIRGTVRQVLNEITNDPAAPLDSTAVERWFGSESANAQRQAFAAEPGPWEPLRGYLHFEDLVAEEGGSESVTTRIAVSTETGSVKPGHLLVIETPYGYGQNVVFAGNLRIRSDCPDRADLVRLLSVALRLIPALGAFKTAGFGRLVEAQLEETPVPPGGPAEALVVELGPDIPHVDLVLNFDAPFVVFARGLGGNMFDGDDIIPGAVIKGAFAEKLRALGRYAEFANALAALHVGHAFPVKIGDTPTRPRTPPLSLYTIKPDGPEELYDDLVAPASSLGELGLVEFAPDWKDRPALVEARYPKPSRPERLRRTRTAVAASGTADTGRLFSHGAVSPEGHEWLSRLLRGPLEHETFAALLSLLRGRLPGIGKTKASAQARIELAPELPAARPIRTSNGVATWRLVVQTPALMFSPVPDPRGDSRRNPEAWLDAAYEGYWRGNADRFQPGLGPRLRLVGFRAQQFWVGGYLAARYRPVADRYYPYLLTAQGSVFHLEAPADAAPFFRKVVEEGLPLPLNWPADRSDWRHCPFLPENGYGEVVAEEAP
jgi:hypothetical protein